MLTEKALLASLPLTERLDAAGYALYPVAGTPLEALVSASRSDASLFDAARGDVPQLVQHIGVMANKSQPFLGCSEHDAVLDSIVQTAITSVNNQIAFARNVVSPVIQDLYSRVQASLGEISKSSLLGMEVEVMGEPQPLSNTSLQAAIRKHEGIAFDSPTLTLRLPDMTLTELTELIGSGGGGLDRDIAEWLAHKGDGFLPRVWQNLFQQTGSGERVRSFGEWVTDRVDGVDVALAVFLLSRKLVEGKPLAGSEMSLGNYRGLLAEFRDQAGAALNRALDKIERAVRVGILVRDVVGSKTVVYEPVYRKFLEAGGSNELLFANSLTVPFATSLEAVLAQKDVLTKRWNSHSSLTKTAESNKRFNKTKELLDMHFRAQLAEHTQGEEGSEHNRAVVIKLFGEQLNLVTAGDLLDLHGLCLRLVCRARFYQTEAERILAGMEQATRENPGLPPREAAAASIVDYCAYWVGTQLRLVK